MAVIAPGSIGWGVQLPVQAQSSLFVQPWERTAGPAELLSVTAAAERAGALYVGVCDHVAIPADKADAMGTTWYDTVATLGWLAAHTTTVRLLSHVFVLPYRHPLVVAKAFSTLDVLSGGRMILGVGAGHVEGEFAALGVDFGSRGRAVEAAVPMIREAFRNEFVEVDSGAHGGVDTTGDGGSDAQGARTTVSVGVGPRPVQVGGPPIWIGGSSKAAIRRAALLGDGWLPQGPPKMGTGAAIEFIAETRADAGLPAEFDIGVIAGSVFVGEPGRDAPGLVLPEHATTGSPERIAESLERFTSRGIDQLQLQFHGVDAAQMCEQIERFGAEVAPLL